MPGVVWRTHVRPMRGRLLMGSTIDRTIVGKNHASGGTSPRHRGTAHWKVIGGRKKWDRRRPRRLRYVTAGTLLLLTIIDIAAQSRRAELTGADRPRVARCAAGLVHRRRPAIAGIVRCRAAVLRTLLRGAALCRRHLHVLRLRERAHREDASGRCCQ